MLVLVSVPVLVLQNALLLVLVLVFSPSLLLCLPPLSFRVGRLFVLMDEFILALGTFFLPTQHKSSPVGEDASGRVGVGVCVITKESRLLLPFCFFSLLNCVKFDQFSALFTRTFLVVHVCRCVVVVVDGMRSDSDDE